MSDEKPKGLYAKLAEVMALVGRIEKRGENTFHHYKYAMESDIVEAVRGALAERSVTLIPSIKQVIREGTLTTALMTFTFVDGVSGESCEKEWAGTGDDKGDKGLYKAMTGALKYFLLKTFLMPTGDDPEGDDATDKRAAGVVTRRSGKAVPTGAGVQCTRCSATALPGHGLCATCQRLMDERKEDDVARAAKAGVSIAADGSLPTEKPPAPSPSQAQSRKRAFALMEKYGIQNDDAHRPDRLALYGKALGLGRLASDDEAKAFSAAQWDQVCAWLTATNEPPLDQAPPWMT